MLTQDDIRRIALDLPEAYEAPHFDVTSFRVAKKIFCTVHVDVPRIVLKLDPEDQHNLAEEDPAIEPVGSTDGKWVSSGRRGWTYVWYEKLAPDRLPGLMRMAWATVAPKRLLKA
jgi:hypothetical protein